MSVGALHHRLLSEAVKIANSDSRLPTYISGTVFVIPTKTDKLALDVAPVVLEAVKDKRYEKRSEQEVMASLRDIVRDAIQESIIRNQREFASLIVEEAREGRNYFDRFKRRKDE